MQFDYDPRLDGLLSTIEQTLVAELPKAIRQLAIREPCYAIFLWYDDSSSDDPTPRFGIGTQTVQNACAAQYSADERSRIDCLWRPQQTLENHGLLLSSKIAATGLSDQCKLAYSLMMAADDSPLPLPDESEILMPFRSMMRRVATQLSKIDWMKVLPTEDHFVVVALDSIGEWLNDDLRSGIPVSKRALLLQRGLLIA